MAIIFRTAGAWGAGKGSNLTPVEVDGNFYDLDQRLDTVENNPVQPIEIDTITLVNNGTALQIELTDNTIYGPFIIPKARFSWQGEWQPLTSYLENDVVSVSGDGVYLIEEDHTSAATFDPDADLTSGGGSTYALMLSVGDITGSGASGVSGAGGSGNGYNGVINVTAGNTGNNYNPAFEPGATVSNSAFVTYRVTKTGTNTGFEIPRDSTMNYPIGTRLWVVDDVNATDRVFIKTENTVTVLNGGTLVVDYIYNNQRFTHFELVKLGADLWNCTMTYERPNHMPVFETSQINTYPTNIQTNSIFRLNGTGAAAFNFIMWDDATVTYPIGTWFIAKDVGGATHRLTVNLSDTLTQTLDGGTTGITTTADNEVIRVVKVAADAWETW